MLHQLSKFIRIVARPLRKSFLLREQLDYHCRNGADQFN